MVESYGDSRSRRIFAEYPKRKYCGHHETLSKLINRKPWTWLLPTLSMLIRTIIQHNIQFPQNWVRSQIYKQLLPLQSPDLTNIGQYYRYWNLLSWTTLYSQYIFTQLFYSPCFMCYQKFYRKVIKFFKALTKLINFPLWNSKDCIYQFRWSGKSFEYGLPKIIQIELATVCNNLQIVAKHGRRQRLNNKLVFSIYGKTCIWMQQ